MWQLCNRTYNRRHREREYAGKPWESHSSRQYASVGVLCQDSPASPLALRWEIHPLHSLTPLDLCPGYVAAFLLFCCSSINTTSVQLEKEIQVSLSLSKSTLNTNCTEVNNNHLQEKYVEASTDLSRIQGPDFNESVLSQKIHIPLFLVRSYEFLSSTGPNKLSVHVYFWHCGLTGMHLFCWANNYQEMLHFLHNLILFVSSELKTDINPKYFAYKFFLNVIVSLFQKVRSFDLDSVLTFGHSHAS